MRVFALNLNPDVPPPLPHPGGAYKQSPTARAGYFPAVQDLVADCCKTRRLRNHPHCGRSRARARTCSPFPCVTDFVSSILPP